MHKGASLPGSWGELCWSQSRGEPSSVAQGLDSDEVGLLLSGQLTVGPAVLTYDLLIWILLTSSCRCRQQCWQPFSAECGWFSVFPFGFEGCSRVQPYKERKLFRGLACGTSVACHLLFPRKITFQCCGYVAPDMLKEGPCLPQKCVQGSFALLCE